MDEKVKKLEEKLKNERERNQILNQEDMTKTKREFMFFRI